MTSRQRLRRALIDLNHPRHERAVVWVNESTPFRRAATRPVRASRKRINRQSYRPARKRKQSNVAAELLTMVGVVIITATVLYGLM